MTENTKPLEEVSRLDDKELLSHLRAKNRQLESLLRSATEARGALQEAALSITEAVRAIDPRPLLKYREGDDSASEIEPVLMLSDWQIGEVVSSEATEGFGKFNWAIAQDRILNQLLPKFIAWVGTHRRSFKINRCHIFGLSDYVSGDIHYELSVTNEFPLPVQTANAGWLLGEAIAGIAPHFKEVVVWEESADNHGRLTRRPQHKQAVLNNMSYLVHAIANASLRKHGNVRIELGLGEKLLADVNGKKWLLEHGHNLLSWMGVPYYGMERNRGREATKRIHTERGFDYMAIAHFHVPAIISDNIFVNGALPGTTEFDHSQGRHALPSQVSFMTHPKYGPFDWTAWKFKPTAE